MALVDDLMDPWYKVAPYQGFLGFFTILGFGLALLALIG